MSLVGEKYKIGLDTVIVSKGCTIHKGAVLIPVIVSEGIKLLDLDTHKLGDTVYEDIKQCVDDYKDGPYVIGDAGLAFRIRFNVSCNGVF